MEPNLLLWPRRVRADSDESLHLLNAGEENLRRDEPANSLGARRCGQAALVGPKVVEVVDLVKGQAEVERGAHLDVGFVEVKHLRHLIEKRRALRGGRVDADTKNSLVLALGISKDKMHFSFAAVAANDVLRRVVNVPSSQISFHVVVLDGWQRVVNPLVVVQGKGGSVAIVVKVTAEVGVNVIQVGLVLARQSLIETYSNGRLLRTSVAQLVAWKESIHLSEDVHVNTY